MEGIQTAEINPRKCRHLAPFKEGKFGAVWGLEDSNGNLRLDMCQTPQQTAEVNTFDSTSLEK